MAIIWILVTDLISKDNNCYSTRFYREEKVIEDEGNDDNDHSLSPWNNPEEAGGTGDMRKCLASSDNNATEIS